MAKESYGMDPIRGIGREGRRIRCGSRGNTVGHLLPHTNSFTTLIEGHSGRGSPKQEFMDGDTEEKRYVGQKRLSMKREKLQAHQLLD